MSSGAARSTVEQRVTLEAFQRALGQEAHVLADQAHLTWQQLHNRLQWVDGPVAELAAAERERRSVPGCAPWIRTRTPFRESGSLLRTLSGHDAAVTACAVSPDGTWIVSGSSDRTLRIWDVVTGKELRTLGVHTTPVTACAVSPDGTWVVSAVRDSKILIVWDVASGQEIRKLRGHAGTIRACAISPDGEWIVSASRDKTLKAWDVATGHEMRTFVGHAHSVAACSISPDGTWVVSASGYGPPRFWDAESGMELLTPPGCENGRGGSGPGSTGLDPKTDDKNGHVPSSGV